MFTRNSELDQTAINAIRILSADAVQKANSGHPGKPLGSAAMAYTLFSQQLKHNPADPNGSTATVSSSLQDTRPCCFTHCSIYMATD